MSNREQESKNKMQRMSESEKNEKRAYQFFRALREGLRAFSLSRKIRQSIVLTDDRIVELARKCGITPKELMQQNTGTMRLESLLQTLKDFDLPDSEVCKLTKRLPDFLVYGTPILFVSLRSDRREISHALHISRDYICKNLIDRLLSFDYSHPCRYCLKYRSICKQ